MQQIEIIWENIENFGCEYFKMEKDEDQLIGKGTIISLEKNKPYKVMYQIFLDRNWQTRKLDIHVDDEKKLTITSDGMGTWLNEQGEQMSQLFGAVDVDISATPFSNTLPINREKWDLGEKKDFNMVYIHVPSLETQLIPQSYTFVSNEGNKRLFQYKCRDFQSYIEIDEHGYVLKYPDLFFRRY
ncbi:putative glycolipid-binding domain-containing protein [Evansella halocellulosilytica]|uniref:putative glycolipid-binding domain-containing protein n=1 Tax=Evansella halocellulosilytica TaxID=2011013 RepID=UPI000BB9742D|nr:putative glycolipid-binding domain-containing protein [Evansella halocellulosilytica]